MKPEEVYYLMISSSRSSSTQNGEAKSRSHDY